MKAYQLKISLKGVKPPIWRRCIIPGGITFSQLSILLNIIMGWSGYHLSGFEFKNLALRMEEDLEDGYFEPMYGFGLLDSKLTYIDEYLENPEAKWFTYTYDYGDDWEHRVEIEKVIDIYNENWARVIKFKGNCPPEDIGGAYMYMHYLQSEAIDNEHSCIIDEDLDFPVPILQYDIDEVNDILHDDFYYHYDGKECRTVGEILQASIDGETGLLASKDTTNTIKPKTASLKQSYERNKQDVLELLSSLYDMYKPSLKDNLMNFTVAEMKDIANYTGLSRISGLKKSALAEKLAKWLLSPDVLKAHFITFTDAQIDAFEKYAYSDGLQFCEEDPDYIFDFLAFFGYITGHEGSYIIVPDDVRDAYLNISTDEFHIKRRQASQITKCIDLCETLYGITPVDTFLQVLEIAGVTGVSKEDFLELANFAISIKTEYTIIDNRIAPIQLLKAEGLAEELHRQQFGKSYYLPTKSEVDDYLKNKYFSKSPYVKEFIAELRSRGAGYEVAQAIAFAFQKRMNVHFDIEDAFALLAENGIEFYDDEDIKRFLNVVEKMHNSTRMMFNSGHTPEEIFNAERRNPPPLPKKTGRNELCLCGSGLKYKYCCGKRTPPRS